MFDPSVTLQIPLAKGNKNVAVSGPDATPPESNEIAVKIDGTNFIISNAKKYPGIKYHQIEIPVRILTSARATESATPIPKQTPKTFPLISPSVTSSTCFLRTITAGSAETIKYPISAPIGTINQENFPAPKDSPSILATGMNPKLTADKKITSPKNVYIRPKQILTNFFDSSLNAAIS